MPDIWTPLDLVARSRLDAEQRTVYVALLDHWGRASAINQECLADATGLNPRLVRDVITSLIVAHGVPIGSSSAPPHGYFIIATPEEAADAYRMLRGHGLSILQRMAAIGRIAADADRRRIQIDLPFTQETLRG